MSAESRAAWRRHRSFVEIQQKYALCGSVVVVMEVFGLTYEQFRLATQGEDA